MSKKTWPVLICIDHILISMRRLPNVVLMLVQRRRRWPNIKTALGKRIMFTGILSIGASAIRLTMWIRGLL